MALVPLLNICIKEKCTKISATDKTGAYNSVTNTTGYGSPNIAPSDADFAATIAVNGGTAIDVTSQVPDPVTGNFTYNDIEVSLPDGWNTIVYTVSNSGNTVSNTIKIFTYCKIKCCIHKKMLELKDLDPCKDNNKIQFYMHMWNLYKSMIFQANGCHADNAADLLTRLQQLCDIDTDADCGCS